MNINIQPLSVGTSWCIDDVKGALDVDHMTDKEIQIELNNLAKAFHEQGVKSGWDVIYNCFNVSKKDKGEEHEETKNTETTSQGAS